MLSTTAFFPLLFWSCALTHRVPLLPVRALAYECLGRLPPLLEASDFRERTQVSVLLSHVRNGVKLPLQRLPASAALLLAEASLGMCSAASPTYTLLNRAVLRKEAMGATDTVDLGLRLLCSGSQQHRLEQGWAARLLYGGLLDGSDVELYRKKYAVERMAAVYGGAGAEAGSQLAALLLATVSRAAAVPSLAAHLALNTGTVPWLTAIVTRCMDTSNPGTAAGGGAVGTALTSLSALTDLAQSLRGQLPQQTAGNASDRPQVGSGGRGGLPLKKAVLPATLQLAAAQLRNAVVLQQGRGAHAGASSQLMAAVTRAVRQLYIPS